MARTVRDLALTLSVMAGPDGFEPDCVPVPLGDPQAVAAAGLRVCVLDPADWSSAAASTRSAVDRAVELLEQRGRPSWVPPSLGISTRASTSPAYRFTLPWSLMGWPAVSLPMRSDPVTGFRLAVQLAAPRWHDHVVLAGAEWLEADSAEG